MKSYGIFWIILDSFGIYKDLLDSYGIFRSSCSSLAGLGLEQYSVLQIPFLESFGIFWILLILLHSFEFFCILLHSFGFFWILLDSFWFFWIPLDSFGFFFHVFGINLILLEYFGFFCLCRLTLKAVSASSFCSWILWIIWNHLEQLIWPWSVVPQSYLAVLWVSWAPRVLRVSRALFWYSDKPCKKYYISQIMSN